MLIESASTSSTSSIAIAAWPIDNILHGKKLAKAIASNLESTTRKILEKEDLRIVESTIAFLKRFQAVYGSSSVPASATEESDEKQSAPSSLFNADMDTMTTAMQEFFYDALLRLEQAEQERLALAEAMQEESEKEKSALSGGPSIDESLERIEGLVCDMLYDRIFSPPQAPDRHDDESLSTRIAGLHMLDLTLDHLGFRLDSTNSSPDEAHDRRVLQDGIDEIVQQCGSGESLHIAQRAFLSNEFFRRQSCRSYRMPNAGRQLPSSMFSWRFTRSLQTHWDSCLRFLCERTSPVQRPQMLADKQGKSSRCRMMPNHSVGDLLERCDRKCKKTERPAYQHLDLPRHTKRQFRL